MNPILFWAKVVFTILAILVVLPFYLAAGRP